MNQVGGAPNIPKKVLRRLCRAEIAEDALGSIERQQPDTIPHTRPRKERHGTNARDNCEQGFPAN